MTSGKQVLFGDVERVAKNVASALTKEGFRQGDILFFVSYDIVDISLLQLAVWMLGGGTRGCFQQETHGNLYFFQNNFISNHFIFKMNSPGK